jgi:dephospho-CoA kinase
MMPVIGVGGSIASGKTTVCRFFEKWGAHVIDADRIGKDVVDSNPSLLHTLVQTFGQGILERRGSLDRRKLGRIVFQDPSARQKLNSVVHPLLLLELRREVEEWQDKEPESVIVIDAALLLEWELGSLLDGLIVVQSDKGHRMERLTHDGRFTTHEAQERIKAQRHLDRRKMSADYVISNNTTIEDLERKAKTVWERIRKSKIPGSKSKTEKGPFKIQ